MVIVSTKEEIDLFNEYAWFVSKKVIPEALMDRIFDATEEFYRGQKDADLPVAGCSRNNEYISFQKKAFRELSLQPIIGAMGDRCKINEHWFDKIPFKLKKGQISFHHSSIIHGSYPNRSSMMRRAIVLKLQDGDNRYQPDYNQGKQIHHFLDSLCRKQSNGFPDYTDSAVFPVVWSNNRYAAN